MKLFAMDLHISVIPDFMTANPDIDVVFWTLSGHSWVLGKQQQWPLHIDPTSWRYLNLDMIQKFQTEYDTFLSEFDGFVVGHCAAFAMIYEKYKKPILMINSCRYDLPFCQTHDMGMLQEWHACIQRLATKGQLTIVSNNRADQEYTRLGTGIRPYYNPSLCLYTNMKYTPSKSTFLCYTGSTPNHPLITQKSELPSPHGWNDVQSFRGIIHIPYEVSTMSMFEQYTAGIPLFVPSKTFWKSNANLQSVRAYWGDRLPDYLSNLQSFDTWIDYSDIYYAFKGPNLYYFDSIPHLFELLEKFEYKQDSRDAYIESVKQEWKHILKRVSFFLFRTMYPPHLSYNRLPLLANVVYDVNYDGSGVTAQHSYPFHSPLQIDDIVFVKTDLLGQFLESTTIHVPITLVTGVSDLSPTSEQTRRILENPYITRWIGCNITATHPKIRKIPIGVGEPERINGKHETLVELHNSRFSWNQKHDSVCIPFLQETCTLRSKLVATLPRLEFQDYMMEITKHKFVICPRGNGIDTHRVCETLLMGSVPILEHSGLDDMYSQFPCILVDSFDSIDTANFIWDYKKYETFLDFFWLRQGLKYYLFVNTMIENTGQIQLSQPFGEYIKKYASDSRFHRYMEIGTWNGRGSTCCFAEGFQQRNDSPILCSYEVCLDKFIEASLLWKSNSNVNIYYGTVLQQHQLPTMETVIARFPQMNRSWHEEDMKNIKKAPYIPPQSPEVVLLDGGEYMTFYEFFAIKDLSSIRVIMLDDTIVDKCRDIRTYLLIDPAWKCIAESTTQRNGWAIFERV